MTEVYPEPETPIVEPPAIDAPPPFAELNSVSTSPAEAYRASMGQPAGSQPPECICPHCGTTVY